MDFVVDSAKLLRNSDSCFARTSMTTATLPLSSDSPQLPSTREMTATGGRRSRSGSRYFSDSRVSLSHSALQPSPDGQLPAGLHLFDLWRRRMPHSSSMMSNAGMVPPSRGAALVRSTAELEFLRESTLFDSVPDDQVPQLETTFTVGEEPIDEPRLASSMRPPSSNLAPHHRRPASGQIILVTETPTKLCIYTEPRRIVSTKAKRIEAHDAVFVQRWMSVAQNRPVVLEAFEESDPEEETCFAATEEQEGYSTALQDGTMEPVTPVIGQRQEQILFQSEDAERVALYLERTVHSDDMVQREKPLLIGHRVEQVLQASAEAPLYEKELIARSISEADPLKPVWVGQRNENVLYDTMSSSMTDAPLMTARVATMCETMDDVRLGSPVDKDARQVSSRRSLRVEHGEEDPIGYEPGDTTSRRDIFAAHLRESEQSPLMAAEEEKRRKSVGAAPTVEEGQEDIISRQRPESAISQQVLANDRLRQSEVLPFSVEEGEEGRMGRQRGDSVVNRDVLANDRLRQSEDHPLSAEEQQARRKSVGIVPTVEEGEEDVIGRQRPDTAASRQALSRTLRQSEEMAGFTAMEEEDEYDELSRKSVGAMPVIMGAEEERIGRQRADSHVSRGDLVAHLEEAEQATASPREALTAVEVELSESSVPETRCASVAIEHDKDDTIGYEPADAVLQRHVIVAQMNAEEARRALTASESEPSKSSLFVAPPRSSTLEEMTEEVLGSTAKPLPELVSVLSVVQPGVGTDETIDIGSNAPTDRQSQSELVAMMREDSRASISMMQRVSVEALREHLLGDEIRSALPTEAAEEEYDRVLMGKLLEHRASSVGSVQLGDMRSFTWGQSGGVVPPQPEPVPRGMEESEVSQRSAYMQPADSRTMGNDSVNRSVAEVATSSLGQDPMRVHTPALASAPPAPLDPEDVAPGDTRPHDGRAIQSSDLTTIEQEGPSTALTGEGVAKRKSVYMGDMDSVMSVSRGMANSAIEGSAMSPRSAHLGSNNAHPLPGGPVSPPIMESSGLVDQQQRTLSPRSAHIGSVSTNQLVGEGASSASMPIIENGLHAIGDGKRALASVNSMPSVSSSIQPMSTMWGQSALIAHDKVEAKKPPTASLDKEITFFPDGKNVVEVPREADMDEVRRNRVIPSGKELEDAPERIAMVSEPEVFGDELALRSNEADFYRSFPGLRWFTILRVAPLKLRAAFIEDVCDCTGLKPHQVVRIGLCNGSLRCFWGIAQSEDSQNFTYAQLQSIFQTYHFPKIHALLLSTMGEDDGHPYTEVVKEDDQKLAATRPTSNRSVKINGDLEEKSSGGHTPQSLLQSGEKAPSSTWSTGQSNVYSCSRSGGLVSFVVTDTPTPRQGSPPGPPVMNKRETDIEKILVTSLHAPLRSNATDKLFEKQNNALTEAENVEDLNGPQQQPVVMTTSADSLHGVPISHKVGQASEKLAMIDNFGDPSQEKVATMESMREGAQSTPSDLHGSEAKLPVVRNEPQNSTIEVVHPHDLAVGVRLRRSSTELPERLLMMEGVGEGEKITSRSESHSSLSDTMPTTSGLYELLKLQSNETMRPVLEQIQQQQKKPTVSNKASQTLHGLSEEYPAALYRQGPYEDAPNASPAAVPVLVRDEYGSMYGQPHRASDVHELRQMGYEDVQMYDKTTQAAGSESPPLRARRHSNVEWVEAPNELVRHQAVQTPTPRGTSGILHGGPSAHAAETAKYPTAQQRTSQSLYGRPRGASNADVKYNTAGMWENPDQPQYPILTTAGSQSIYGPFPGSLGEKQATTAHDSSNYPRDPTAQQRVSQSLQGRPRGMSEVEAKTAGMRDSSNQPMRPQLATDRSESIHGFPRTAELGEKHAGTGRDSSHYPMEPSTQRRPSQSLYGRRKNSSPREKYTTTDMSDPSNQPRRTSFITGQSQSLYGRPGACPTNELDEMRGGTDRDAANYPMQATAQRRASESLYGRRRNSSPREKFTTTDMNDPSNQPRRPSFITGESQSLYGMPGACPTNELDEMRGGTDRDAANYPMQANAQRRASESMYGRRRNSAPQEKFTTTDMRDPSIEPKFVTVHSQVAESLHGFPRNASVTDLREKSAAEAAEAEAEMMAAQRANVAVRKSDSLYGPPRRVSQRGVERVKQLNCVESIDFDSGDEEGGPFAAEDGFLTPALTGRRGPTRLSSVKTDGSTPFVMIDAKGYPGIRPVQNPYRDALLEIKDRNDHVAGLSLTPGVAADMCYPTNAHFYGYGTAIDLYHHYCRCYRVPANSGVVKAWRHIAPPSAASDDLLLTDPLGLASLQYVSLPCMALKDAGWLPVLEVLRWCPNLRVLDISDNDLSNEAVEWLVEATGWARVMSSRRVSNMELIKAALQADVAGAAATSNMPPTADAISALQKLRRHEDTLRVRYGAPFNELSGLKMNGNHLSMGALALFKSIVKRNKRMSRVEAKGIILMPVRGSLPSVPSQVMI